MALTKVTAAVLNDDAVSYDKLGLNLQRQQHYLQATLILVLRKYLQKH
jgi:hypothetical protein